MGNCTEDDGLGLDSWIWDWNFGNSDDEKPNWYHIMAEIEKTLASECPMIGADPNEAATGPICNDYFCARDCNEGFIPSHPMKVSLSSGNSTNNNFRSSVKKIMMQICGPHLMGKQNWVYARKIMDRDLGTGIRFWTGTGT